MSPEIYKKTYKNFQDLVEKKLSDYVTISEPLSLYEPFKYFISDCGKRIRPVLAMMCAGAVGGEPESAVDVGTAIEILHNFTLVHDDIMDKSPMRRNRPTVHIKWNEPVAILVGDVMVGYAYNLLPTPNQHIRSGLIYKAFTEGLIKVCEGQALDMDFNLKPDVNMKDYINMIEKKTAWLLRTAAVIGGHIGVADENEISTLDNFALNLGLAFQFQDDLLDLTADEAKLGKTVGQDIVEGKKTCLIISAYEKAKINKDKKLLNKLYKEKGLSKEFVPEVKEMMFRLGVIEDIGIIIKKYFKKSEKYLKQLLENDYTEMLYSLIDSLDKRVY